MFRQMISRMREEGGGSLVEYALLLSLIAMVCFGAVSFFGGNTKDGGAGYNHSACMIGKATGDSVPIDCGP